MSSDTTIGGDVGKYFEEAKHGATHLSDIDLFTGRVGNPNSFINQINPGEWLLGQHGLLGKDGMSVYEQTQKLFEKKGEDPAAPPKVPTLGETNLVALQGQLSHEERAAAASTILNGGVGLLDEPTTASQVLLGS